MRQWAESHQQNLVNLGVAPGKLNPIPEEMAQILALLEEAEREYED